MIFRENGTPNDRFHYVSLQKFGDPTRSTHQKFAGCNNSAAG